MAFWIDDIKNDLGITVLMVEHDMTLVSRVSDRVLALNYGEVIAQGTPAQLAASAGAATVVSFRVPDGVGVADLPTVGDDARLAGAMAEIRTRDATRDLHVLTTWALDRGVDLDDITLTRPSLEDVYLDLVGERGGEPVRSQVAG